jgi:chaperone required for assembly of F1-ATPase
MSVDQPQGAPSEPRGRRYREAVAVADGESWIVALDGRPATTPAGATLRLPTRPLAIAVAQEWSAARARPDPRTMPLTRLAGAALDGVASDPDATLEDLVRYARSDLLCYRAAHPASLVAAQQAAWDPILDWARDSLGARFLLSEGVVHVEQPPTSIAAVRDAARALATPFGLAALHVMTHLGGSVLLALAVARGRLPVEAAWRAAHVDEDAQIAVWGEDAEAARRRAHRFDDMASAAQMLALAEGMPA